MASSITQTLPVREWRLKDFLAGYALGDVMWIFEEVVGPFAKEKVSAYFAQDPQNPPPHFMEFRQRVLARLKERKTSRNELLAKMSTLQSELPPRPYSRDDKKKVNNSTELNGKNLDLKRKERSLKRLNDGIVPSDEREQKREDLHALLLHDQTQKESVLLELAKLDNEDAQFLNEEVPQLLWVLKCRSGTTGVRLCAV
jgi:hypothetical protein